MQVAWNILIGRLKEVEHMLKEKKAKTNDEFWMKGYNMRKEHSVAFNAEFGGRVGRWPCRLDTVSA